MALDRPRIHLPLRAHHRDFDRVQEPRPGAAAAQGCAVPTTAAATEAPAHLARQQDLPALGNAHHPELRRAESAEILGSVSLRRALDRVLADADAPAACAGLRRRGHRDGQLHVSVYVHGRRAHGRREHVEQVRARHVFLHRRVDGHAIRRRDPRAQRGARVFHPVPLNGGFRQRVPRRRHGRGDGGDEPERRAVPPGDGHAEPISSREALDGAKPAAVRAPPRVLHLQAPRGRRRVGGRREAHVSGNAGRGGTGAAWRLAEPCPLLPRHRPPGRQVGSRRRVQAASLAARHSGCRGAA